MYELVKKDILSEDWEKYNAYSSVLGSGHYTPEELLHLKESAFRQYYLRWGWISRRMMGVVAC
jgi:hypothetical protein